MTELNLTDEQRAVLRKAADVVEERGLTYGSGVDVNGCVCTLGALCVALGLDPNDWAFAYDGRTDYSDDGETYVRIDPVPEYVELVNKIAPAFQPVFNEVGHPVARVYVWNDDYIGNRRRSKDEVVAHLRKVAEL